MASGLPPPPTRADNGDFAWVAWYNSLYTLLSTTGAVNWAQVNKAGSSITDLQNHNHNLLTSIDGDGTNHVSAAELTKIQNLGTMSAQNVGVSGTFKSGDIPQKTITVVNGIITSIV